MKPILYIIMRNDLASLNAGKAMAQAAHASNFFVKGVTKLRNNHPVRKLYEVWAKQTSQGFGTTIVLGGDMFAIGHRLARIVEDADDCSVGLVIDPTYPLRDGKVTHEFSLTTCGYVFCEEGSVAAQMLRVFELHP